MNKRKISKYIDLIDSSHGYILFNKINGCIILLEKNNILLSNDCCFIQNLNDDDINYLEENDFFISSQIVENYIRNNLNKPKIDEEVSITISVTEQCNLSCKYCYQKNWNKQEHIKEKDYVNIIISYINKVVKEVKDINGIIHIHFIGGEPLLKKNLILEIVSEIENSIKYKNIFYDLDSNICYLDSKFIKKFPNLLINTTVTSEKDHNNLRSNSYTDVVSVLNSLKDILEDDKYKLVIRYNCHEKNIDEFEDVLLKLKDMNLKFEIDIENIQNFENSDFINHLSEDDFENIFLNKLVPILLKESFEVDLLPPYGLRRHCLGENSLSCKFYSNGETTLCDAFPKGDNPINSKLEQLPEMCIHCSDFPYCGGPKPCDKNKCEGYFSKKTLYQERIKKYVEYFFVNED